MPNQAGGSTHILIHLTGTIQLYPRFTPPLSLMKYYIRRQTFPEAQAKK